MESLPRTPDTASASCRTARPAGEVRAAYIMGEDPLQTDAELFRVRKAFRGSGAGDCSGYLYDQNRAAADVILPSTSGASMEGVYTVADRGFQRFFKAVEPKWDLKTDWQIISEIATRIGYLDALATTPVRSGTSCGICVRLLWGNL